MSTSTFDVDQSEVHALAEEYLSGDYTIEWVEFTDCDTRIRAKHSYGWNAYNRVEEVFWVSRGTIWLEYYEGDTLRLRDKYELEEYPGYDEWLPDDAL